MKEIELLKVYTENDNGKTWTIKKRYTALIIPANVKVRWAKKIEWYKYKNIDNIDQINHIVELRIKRSDNGIDTVGTFTHITKQSTPNYFNEIYAEMKDLAATCFIK